VYDLYKLYKKCRNKLITVIFIESKIRKLLLEYSKYTLWDVMYKIYVYV